MCSMLQLGRMALHGVFGKKQLGKLEERSWDFGVRDTKDLQPVNLQLKKRYCQLTKGFEPLQNWLAPKHSLSCHLDCQCWSGCQKGKPLPHVMPLMLHGASVSLDHTAGLNSKPQLPRNLGSYHKLA